MNGITRCIFGAVLCLSVALGMAAPAARAQCTNQALQLSQQQLSKTLKYINTTHFAQLTVLNSQKTYSKWNSVGASDWTSGFFPGWIWYMYEQSLESSLLSRAEAQTASLYGETTDGSTSDTGFRIANSYINGWRVTRDPSYMSAIQQAARTMAKLYISFPDGTGTINSNPSFDPSHINVIIDNMPSLELLFFAAKHGGNPAWYTMALNHALKAMNNQVRSDGSTYQGVKYNSNGTVYDYYTNDGASAGSTWSRGQAWAMYGFTMSYRYTGNTQLLDAAEKVSDYFINHLPPDGVPYWDFTKSNPKDSSAAAIAAAALIELNRYVGATNDNMYRNAAMNILNSLSSSAYLGNPLSTGGILLHGTYSVPSNVGIDTSLIWGDYYFLQGCFRATPLPARVTGVSAGTVASNEVRLNWQPQTGAIRYNVKRSTVSGGPYTYIAPPPVLTTNTFTDSSVAPNTTYDYVVSASGVAGEGADSAELQVTTPAATAAPSFSIGANPASLTLNTSTNPAGSTQLTVSSADGFAGSVSFGVSGVPKGVTAQINPSQVNLSSGGSASATLTASVSYRAQPGSYTLKVTASGSGASQQTLAVPLQISAAGVVRWGGNRQ